MGFFHQQLQGKVWRDSIKWILLLIGLPIAGTVCLIVYCVVSPEKWWVGLLIFIALVGLTAILIPLYRSWRRQAEEEGYLLTKEQEKALQRQKEDEARRKQNKTDYLD